MGSKIPAQRGILIHNFFLENNIKKYFTSHYKDTGQAEVENRPDKVPPM
jgi:hypothetical protein